MKDVEELLKRSGSAKPGRSLRASFTSDITNYLAQNPRLRTWERLKENSFMKWFTKPAIALSALGVLIITGGAAYAGAGGWANIVSLFGGQQTMPNGDRIVRVDTKNCNYVSAFNIAEGSKAQDQLFYRVKANSKLTNEQVVELVQGNCISEEQAKFDMTIVNEAISKNPLNKDRIVGGYADSVVTAVSESSLSLESVVPYATGLKTIKQTFNHIDSDVLVYQSPNRLAWSDIKIGDHVSIKYRASGEALTKSETTPPDQLDTDSQVVVVVSKNTSAYTSAIGYQKYNGSEFEEVVPCTNQPDGYCNYEQKLGQ